jgi:hypothetical protein
MAKGSATQGLLGILTGILVALLAIFIGAGSVRLSGGGHEASGAHGAP